MRWSTGRILVTVLAAMALAIGSVAPGAAARVA